MAKKLAFVLTLLVGVNIPVAGQETLRAGCSRQASVWWVPLDNPAPDSPITGFPVAWVLGSEGPRAIGLFGYGPRKPFAVLAGVECDPNSFGNSQVPIHDVAYLPGSIVLGPDNPNDIADGVRPEDLLLDYRPSPSDLLTMIWIRESDNGQLFQEATLLHDCYLENNPDAESWWCHADMADGADVPLLGMVFTNGKFVGRSLARNISGSTSGVQFFVTDENWMNAAEIALPVEELVTPQPAGFEIEALYPTTTQGPVTLVVGSSESRQVRIELFDLAGRRQATFFSGTIDGSTEFVFDLNEKPRPSGRYFVRVTDGTRIVSKKVVLIR